MKEKSELHVNDIPHETPEAVENGEYEVEVKYIIDSIPKEIEEGIRVGLYKYRIIEQGYLRPTGKDGKATRMRIRKTYHPDYGEEYRLTDKSGIKGSEAARFEHEIPVDNRETFDGIWALTEGHRVHKTRYYIPYRHPELKEDLIIELDIFHDSLEGLILAEVEFQVDQNGLNEAEEKARILRKTPPGWFGRDVTGDKEWKNSRLAANGLPA